MHLAGWQALGWQVLTPAIPAEGEAGEAGEPVDQDPDQELAPDLGPGGPELGQPGPESDLEPAPDPGPVSTRPVEPGPDHQASDGPQPASPEPAELECQGTDGEQQLATPDFAAMTKAEIMQHCSTHYGVLMDSGLTKSALVAEAEALAATRLPDALVDDLMT